MEIAMALDKILVVVDPTREQQPAFDRGIESARLTGAVLHLYICLGEEDDPNLEGLGRRRLNHLMNLAADASIECSDELERAASWQQQIAVAAARNNIDMIFKDSFEHRDVERELRGTSDWTLLRLSPCPVLLVKNHRDWKHRRVLASVNNQTTDEAHIKLNHRIIHFAQQFSDAYGSDAHFVTAYQDRNNPPSSEAQSAIFGAPLEHIHLVEGNAASAISETAEKIEADLVIVGTVARSGIKGRVVGNTSERVLDHTLADVLVIN
jgi:universal stress protein E